MSSSSEAEEEASAQLTRELQHATLRSFDFRCARPTLKHLNADSSWVLSLPYPGHVQAPSGRCRYNIVVDAWLRGPQVDLFSRFSSQEHATPSVFQTLGQVNEQLREAERLALHASDVPPVEAHDYFIDAVCCSHEFTDHCHEATLRELPPNVPVFAPRKAAALVRSWKHFESVVEIPVLRPDFDWRSTVGLCLPEWIGMGRIHTKGDAPIYFHSALAIVFSLNAGENAEAIVYTPHGAAADSLQVMTTGEPEVEVLALLHGLHDISLVGAQLNMGITNALKAQEILNSKYWLPTHDEIKVGRGLVAPFLRRIEHTLPMAPASHTISEPEDKSNATITRRGFFGIGNGESLILN